MSSVAISEDRMRVFLGRKRRRRTLIEPPALAAWLAQTLDLARSLVPCQAGSLLLDEPGRRGRSPLTFVAAFGPAAGRLIGMNVPPGRGIAGHVYASGETWLTDCPADDPHFFGNVDESASFSTRCVVAAPIRLEKRVCGVFELVNRERRASFSEKDRLTVELFAQHVSRAILNAVDILKQNELALRDDLTGLFNTRGLTGYLKRGLSRRNRDLALLFIDVDRLKSVNDRLGHHAGSEVLRRVGRCLAEAIARLPDARAYRFGGDEFVVVMPGASMDDGARLADDIRSRVSESNGRPMRHGGGSLPKVTVSIGVASAGRSLREGGSSAPQDARLLAAADKALYRAKRRGRDTAVRATRRDDTLGR